MSFCFPRLKVLLCYICLPFSSYNSIVVNPALTTPIITTPNITLSSSQSETINSIVYNGTVPYSYQWYSGTSSTCSSDSQISGATLNSITVSPTSTTYYCISVKDNSQIPVTLYSNTEKITITVQTSGGSSGGSGGGGGGGGGFGGGGGGGSITKKVIPNIKIAGYENKNVTLIYNNSSVIISAYNISNPDNIMIQNMAPYLQTKLWLFGYLGHYLCYKMKVILMALIEHFE